MQFMEPEFGAVFDDESRCRVHIEVNILAIMQSYLVAYHGNLTFVQVETHDRVCHRASVNSTVFEVPHEQHSEMSFEVHRAVFQINQFETPIHQVSLVELEDLILLTDNPFNSLDPLVLCLIVFFSSSLDLGLNLSLPLESELGSRDLLVEFLDLCLQICDFLLELPLVIVRHRETDLSEVFSQSSERIPQTVHNLSLDSLSGVELGHSLIDFWSRRKATIVDLVELFGDPANLLFRVLGLLIQDCFGLFELCAPLLCMSPSAYLVLLGLC